jgi:hypothetical protein
LGALEQGDRKVNPCLIHADLWEGNIGIASGTGDIYIYDAAAFYAHNEMEIANWRGYYNKIGDKVYTETYLKYYEPDEPKDEWDDRNRLYSIYYSVIYSVNHLSQGKAIRQLYVQVPLVLKPSLTMVQSLQRHALSHRKVRPLCGGRTSKSIEEIGNGYVIIGERPYIVKTNCRSERKTWRRTSWPRTRTDIRTKNLNDEFIGCNISM